MGKTKITAHAGCMGTPNDSLEAVKVAVNIKAEICEVDVSALSDGTPVLKHDRVLPADLELVKLSEVFEYMKDKDILLNLDIKDNNSLKQIELLAEYYGLVNRVFLTGIAENEAIHLCDTGFKIKYYLNNDLKPSIAKLNYDDYLNKLIETIKKLGCIGLNSHYGFCTERAVEKFHDNGLLVSVWTVDNSDDMKKLIEMGVDNITTRRPDLLLDIL
jgi:glycerophosphoryl diester phosphodiesterase